MCFTHEEWGRKVWEMPKVFGFRVKAHLHILMTGKDLTLPEFYFLYRFCYYKKTSLKFLPNYTSRTFKTVCLFLIWRYPWVFPSPQAKLKTSEVFKAWLASSCWNVICIPYLPEFPWTGTQTFPCESSSETKPLLVHLLKTKF